MSHLWRLESELLAIFGPAVFDFNVRTQALELTHTEAQHTSSETETALK